MPTEIVHIVDPDNGVGTDYTSLSAWESAQQRDLTSVDEIAVATCRSTSGSADASAPRISGWTTDATRYIKIWTDPAESHRHDGKWASTKSRLSNTDAHVIRIKDDHVRLIGLQIVGRGEAASAGTCIGMGAGVGVAELEISHCVLKADLTASGNGKGYGVQIDNGSAGSVVKIYNCVVYDYTDGGGIRINLANYTAYIHNCTTYNCDKGILNDAGTVTAKNCLSDGGTIGCFSGTFTSSNNNASSDATAPGTSSRINQDFTYVDETNRDLHLASGDAGAKGFGADLSADANLAFSDDIDGDTRSTPWDIGADAIVVAGSMLKTWNGSAWVLKPLKRWDGSAWQTATLKRWNGSSWVTV